MARERQALNGAIKGTDMENKQNQNQEQDTDQLRLAKLGALGILSESIKCYFEQARFFSCILFTLGIPLLLYTIVVKILSPSLLILHPSTSSQVAAQSHSQRQFSAPGVKTTSATGDPDELVANQIIRFWNLFLDGNPHVWTELSRKAIPVLGLLIGASILNQVCEALWDSGTGYTVGLIYCRALQLRESSVVPFFDHVMRTIPRLLYRVIRTSLWAFFLLMILCIISVVPLIVIFLLPLSLEAALFPLSILWLFFFTSLVGIVTVADVAEMVTILDPEEGSYGLEAFKKARTLLKGKWKVAILLEFVWVVIFFSIDRFIQPPPFTVNRWNRIRILVIVTTCVAIWGVNQLRGISVAVLYVSLKAFHGVSTTGLQTEERTKWFSISSASCATDAKGAYGLAEKQATGTDHRYSLLPV